MLPRVLGIAGHVRSGKTHAADYIGRTYGARVFKNSKPIGEVIARLDGVRDRTTFAALGLAMLDVFGRDLIARHWVRTIEIEEPQSLYVVEGIRYEEELKFYAGSVDFKMLGIRASDAERYRRAGLAPDRRKDQGQSLEQFLALKSIPNESQIDSIVGRAHVVIDNNGSVEEFNRAIDSALNALWRH